MKDYEHFFYNFMSEQDSIKNVTRFSILFRIISLVHLILCLIFILTKIYPLAILNFISIFYYNLLVILVKKEKIMLAFQFTYAEIMLQTAMANVIIGFKLGFQLYMIALIPVSFYVAFYLKKLKMRICFSIISAVLCMFLFVGCKFWDVKIGPVYHFNDPSLETSIFIFNAIVSYAMLILFSLLLLIKIYQFQISISETNKKLEEIAYIDPLTGLLNRRKFLEELEKMADKITYIILCDVDDFKLVNDTYGHGCGDLVLIELAKIFKETFPTTNLICRWGGEEICVAVMGNRVGVCAKAEQLRKSIETFEMLYEHNKVSVTITIAIEEYTEMKELQTVFAKVDQKLYEGKRTGKNCVVI